MPIYSSLDRLNAMERIFNADGNGKLDRGEVDAIAGFYHGLSARSKAKVKDRVIEIFRNSDYSKQQEQRFTTMLKHSGIPNLELFGGGFQNLPSQEQFETLSTLEWNASKDFVNPLANADIPPNVLARMKSELPKIAKEVASQHSVTVEEVSFDDMVFDSIDFEEGSPEVGRAGYAGLLPTTTFDHDVTSVYFFNLKGERLGSDYRGE